VFNDASKFWKPPIPTRFIHSKSALMPCLVMLPFIQCHQTRGLALSGGFRKFCRSESPGGGAAGRCAARNSVNKTSDATLRGVIMAR